MNGYFYRDKAGREIGPLDLVTLSKFRMAGVLDGDTPVRAADSAEWKPCREVIADTPAIPAAPIITKGPVKISSNGILIALFAIVVVVIIATRSSTQHTTESPGLEDLGNPGGIRVKMTGDTTINPLDKEAAKQALDCWKPTKLGQSFYVARIVRSGPHSTDTVKTIYELRNIRVELSPQRLSEADKLNGAQWAGEIWLKADAERSYCPQSRDDPSSLFGRKILPPDTTWSRWTGDFYWVTKYDKTNGKWTLDGDSFFGQVVTFKQVEPSDLPDNQSVGQTPAAKAISPANACINNLRQIDGAINEWALETGQRKGAIPTWNDVKQYIKLDANGEVPGCPAGGIYTLHPVGSNPQVSCSIPGHVLP